MASVTLRIIRYTLVHDHSMTGIEVMEKGGYRIRHLSMTRQVGFGLFHDRLFVCRDGRGY